MERARETREAKNVAEARSISLRCDQRAPENNWTATEHGQHLRAYPLAPTQTLRDPFGPSRVCRAPHATRQILQQKKRFSRDFEMPRAPSEAARGGPEGLRGPPKDHPQAPENPPLGLPDNRQSPGASQCLPGCS